MKLTEKELEIVECLVHGWEESDHKLYGDISYQAVWDLLGKLGYDTTEAEERLAKVFDGMGATRVQIRGDHPTCFLCKKPITGQVFYQGGQRTHPAHEGCRISIGPPSEDGGI